jgi:hypothetical protein
LLSVCGAIIVSTDGAAVNLFFVDRLGEWVEQIASGVNPAEKSG